MPLLAVGVGGFLGAIARYLIDGWISDANHTAFPFGTFAINLSGSFLLGLLFALSTERAVLPAEIRAPLMIGFLGAYTTFSTYTLETTRLLESGSWGLAALNLVASVVAGVGAAIFGLAVGRSL